jgi:hypothetical protein
MYRKIYTLKNLHTELQRICVFDKIIGTKRKYSPIQHYVIRYYNRDGESGTD